MSGMTLPSQELRRLYWYRQGLAERLSARDPVSVVSKLCGLHAQFRLSPILSLWNRIENFNKEWFDHALYEARTLAKTWLMRGTVHIIPSSELPMYHIAIQRDRLPSWRRLQRKMNINPSLMAGIEKKILNALQSEDMTRDQLSAVIPELQSIPSKSWGIDVKGLAYQGKLLFSIPEGGRSKFVLRKNWLPSLRWKMSSKNTALNKILKRYLHCYGPASLHDFQFWSGASAQASRLAFQSIKAELMEVKYDQMKQIWILKNDEKDLERIPDVDSLRLLPRYDSFLMCHFDKLRIVNQKFKSYVFRKAAVIEASIGSNGELIGTWNTRRSGSQVIFRLELFRRLTRNEKDYLNQEFDALCDFLEFGNWRTTIHARY